MSHQKPENNAEPGLLKTSKPVFLAFAKIRKPHGLHGEISVEMLTDFPNEFDKGSIVYLGKDHVELVIDSIRKAGARYLIALQKHGDRNSVEYLRNKMMFIKSDSLPELGDGEYFHHDLIGMTVYDMENTQIGLVSEIITTGANDVYVIAPNVRDNKEILLPAIRSVIKNINLDEKRIVVKMPEWL